MQDIFGCSKNKSIKPCAMVNGDGLKMSIQTLNLFIIRRSSIETLVKKLGPRWFVFSSSLRA